MTPPTFIIGHDGSAYADVALTTATALGDPTAAALVLVFVHHQPGSLAASTAASTEHGHALETVATSLEKKVTEELTGYSGTWTFHQRHGDPANELMTAAAEHRATAIIVGHRGHNTLTDLLIGSVATRLVHHSPVTVVVAR